MTLSSPTAENLYHQAQIAFERGRYGESIKTLNQAIAIVEPNTPLEGEIKTWLVTAYEAAGENQRARDLCQQLQQHPHRETRKQNRRLMGILSAPRLRRHSDWLTEIPDLTQVSEKREKTYARYESNSKSAPAKPIDLSPDPYQDVKPDLGFVWVVLGGLILGIGAWAWWG